MAQTKFSGPVVSTNGFVGSIGGDGTVESTVRPDYFVLSGSNGLAASLADIDDAYNTYSSKTGGYQLVDFDTGLIYTATGSLPASAWVASSGSAGDAIYPA